MGRKRSVNIAGMTAEERRAYNRDKKARYIARRAAGVPVRKRPLSGEIACSKCGVVKPYTAEHFYWRADGYSYLQRVCKECRSVRSSLVATMRKYKLTEAQVALLRARPCVLCGSVDDVHIDHCHATGHVRNVLCRLCNHGLGNFRDNPALLRLAAQYVEHYAAQHACQP